MGVFGAATVPLCASGGLSTSLCHCFQAQLCLEPQKSLSRSPLTPGNALFKAQDYAAAAAEYTRAIDALPHPVYYSNRAACFLKLEEYDKAAADCKAGLDHVPEFQKPRAGVPELKPDTPVKLTFRWSQALEDQHNYSAAIYVCNSGLKTYPGNESLTTQLKKLQWAEKKNKRDMKQKAYTHSVPTPDASPVARPIEIHTVGSLPDSLQSIYNTPETTELLESPKQTMHSFPTEMPLILPQVLNSYTLAQLLKSPPSQIEDVRKFLYNYDYSQWPHIFGRGGIDSEFIEQMMTAIVEYANGPERPTEILQSIEKCGRFNIAKRFVPKALLDQVTGICGGSVWQ